MAIRRKNSQLAVASHKVFEPIGEYREPYYQQKLLLGLPWHCPDGSPFQVHVPGGERGQTREVWRFVSEPGKLLGGVGGDALAPVELELELSWREEREERSEERE